MGIKKLYTFFTETIIRRPEEEWSNGTVRMCVRLYKLIYYMVRGLLNHGTLVRSAALTYYTVMSLVPVIAVVFAVVKGFGLADGLIGSLYGLFPQSPEIIDYLAILLIIPILWAVGSAMGRYMDELLGVDGSWYFTLLSKLVSMLFIWVMFTLFYLIIPNAKVRLRSALTAGIAAGTVFLLFQWGYVYAQKAMTSYNAIYGSFAALPLFLIWIQISWEILLIGGELSFTYQNIARFGEEHEWQQISYDQRRKVLLATQLLVVRHFRQRGGAMTREEILREMDLPTRVVNDALFQLTAANQLIEVQSGKNEEAISYTPAYDIAQMTLYGVLQAVEQHGEHELELTSTDEAVLIDEMLDRLTTEALYSTKNVKLTELIR